MRRTVVWEKMSEAWFLLLCDEDEAIDPTRWGGEKVVMMAVRGAVFVDDPEEADLEAVRVRPGLIGAHGSGSEALGLGGMGFGMRREVRPPPGRYVFRGAVSCRQGLRSQFSGAE